MAKIHGHGGVITTAGTDSVGELQSWNIDEQAAVAQGYAPAHLSTSIDAANLTLDWVRRTRIDGDSWLDTDDIPLGEEFERYLVEIGPAGSPDISQEVSDTTTAVIDVSGLSGGYSLRQIK